MLLHLLFSHKGGDPATARAGANCSWAGPPRPDRHLLCLEVATEMQASKGNKPIIIWAI